MDDLKALQDLEALQTPISNQTDVAMKITKQLVESEFKDKNMIYSPLSIYIVLSLIAARTNNPQLVYFLNSKSIDDLNSIAFNLVTSVLADSTSKGGPLLNFTNGLWVDESMPLEESYKQVVLDSYKAALNEVDFKTDPEQVRIQVNSWVEEQTKGRIPKILPPGSVHSATSLIFANALYFKATWEDDYFYKPRKSKDLKFYLLNGDSVKGVPFMSSSHEHSIAVFDDFKVLSLQYSNCALEDSDNGTDKYDPRSFSMLWLLPDARDGLPALAERVCSESRFFDRHLNFESFTSVKVKKFLIPKFKMSSRFEASSVLQKLGLGDGCDSIFHECVVEVDENGTTAATATCAELVWSMGEPPKPKVIEEFVADHPFMFLIRENRTRTVMFMGQVLNPLAGKYHLCGKTCHIL
uniref:serpin-ZX-like isoform X1 n=1 Tax=Fragaria vesca subsp. vesca TaxID=101020 RepID=UPI0005C9C536|nr:PREDICTED: serpin-ZX-like isoform X1 [Fragaria vesca subsp. vesca]XP_011465025.1 PREDICTED: serpin-ZX-like isoform X2 [Fragaria vesca subsp. vesca]